MLLLWIGLALFIGVHLLPSTPLRNALQGAVGDKPYRLLFTAVALVGLVLIVMGYKQAPFEMMFAPKPWARSAAFAAMPVAFILLAAANMPSYIRQFTGHPMMIATLIWSTVHYFANGELAAVWLFGSFMVWSAISILSSTLRGQQTRAASKPVAVKFDIIAVVSGLVLYAAVMHGHGWLFGRSLLG